ncbi:MAG: thiamine phosphate synthase [Sarcina sp.]
MERMSLYLVTDSDIIGKRNFYEVIEEALKAGCKCVQLREKNCLGKEFLEKALKLRELTKKYGALFIVNDRVDIAILSDADGVHVGQDDIPLKEVRKLMKNKIIGVSANNIEEAIIAQADGADYIGVGAIFTTNTKLDANNVGIAMLKNIMKEVKLPIVAIGGLKTTNINQILDERILGYAVVSDILGEKDVFAKTSEWMNIISNMKAM